MAMATPVAEKSAIRTVLPGLLLAMLLAMLDALIVSTALPAIVADLGGFGHLSWVVAAYLLTSTVSTPVWGKLGDLYGRKSLFASAIVIFLVGSALCGVATSMGALVAFRALQGLGAGGLIVGVMTIIGVLAPPEERGRYQSHVAALSAVATIAGPLLGGVLTDYLSWRWTFYINLPIGLVALALVATKLRLPHTRIEHRIDFLGAALLTVVTTVAILVSVWGGTRYAWTSPQLLTLAVVAVVGFAAIVVVERRASEPILPPRLFGVRDFAASLVLGFLVGVAMYGAITFLPLYQQNVQRASATSSGLLLLPVLVGQLVTSIFSGRAMKSPTRYRPFSVLGGLALAIGSLLLSQLDVGTSRTLSASYMVVFGIGLGFLFQNVLVIAQKQRGAPGYRRGQRHPDVLPLGRRYVRCVAVLGDLHQPSARRPGHQAQLGPTRGTDPLRWPTRRRCAQGAARGRAVALRPGRGARHAERLRLGGAVRRARPAGRIPGAYRAGGQIRLTRTSSQVARGPDRNRPPRHTVRACGCRLGVDARLRRRDHDGEGASEGPAAAAHARTGLGSAGGGRIVPATFAGTDTGVRVGAVIGDRPIPTSRQGLWDITTHTSTEGGGTASRYACRASPNQPRDRATAVHHAEHRRAAPDPGLPQVAAWTALGPAGETVVEPIRDGMTR